MEHQTEKPRKEKQYYEKFRINFQRQRNQQESSR